MSTIAGIERLQTERAARSHPSPALLRALGISALAVAGSVSMFPMWSDAWNLWSTDPLRSIGAIFPLVSLILVLLRWREIGYRLDGSYWGLVPVALAAFGSRLFNAAKFEVQISHHRVGLLHPGMLLFAYGVGCVLLFGGVPLLRRAILPLCLLLALNPVPRAFNAHVDFPLQVLSANTARGFAHLIGLRPTGAQLKMMFAPDFGMMIVPGCNGVRGAVTLAYLASIFGYTRRLRFRWLALLGCGGFLMGYALNLTRLCVLVIYYRIGLSVPAIKPYGTEIDYVIGCTIFLFATLSIGVAVRVLQWKTGAVTAAAEAEASGPTALEWRRWVPQSVCFALVTAAFIVPQARAIAAARQPAPTADEVIAAMPAQVGQYRLTRTWTEHDTNGRVSLVLGDYAPANGGERFTLGLWMGGGNHFVAVSRLFQGMVPKWNGTFDAMAQHGVKMKFLADFYDDGVTRSFDAETACSSSGCEETLVLDKNTGTLFSSPDLADLAVARASRRLPILLRREWTDAAIPEAALRDRFEIDARDFVSHLDVTPLLLHAGSH